MNASPYSLAGRTILVTGASSGIGRRTAQEAAALGAAVVLTGRHADRLGRAGAVCNEDAPGAHRTVICDLLNDDDRAALVHDCPQLHGVVHAAGASRVAPMRFTTSKILREMWSINVEAPLLLTRELLGAGKLETGCSLVFLSSLSGAFGWPGYVAYGSAKAALPAAARALAAELAPMKMRCNCLAPGMVRTPMIEGGFSKEQLEKDEARYPLGYGTAADVAHAAVFFLADASRWITGQTLLMEGGATLQ